MLRIHLCIYHIAIGLFARKYDRINTVKQYTLHVTVCVTTENQINILQYALENTLCALSINVDDFELSLNSFVMAKL